MPASERHGDRPSQAAGRRSGEGRVWICGGALALGLLMVLGLLLLLAVHGLAYFRPRPLERITLAPGTTLVGAAVAGTTVLGEVWERRAAADPTAGRLKIRLGNRDVYGNDFAWIDEDRVVDRDRPASALRIDRRQNGPFFGWIEALRADDGEPVATDQAAALDALPPMIAAKHAAAAELRALLAADVADLDRALEELRLDRRRLTAAPAAAERAVELAALDRRDAELRRQADVLAGEVRARRQAIDRAVLVLRTADGQRLELPVAEVVAYHRPNAMTTGEAIRLYVDRVIEFLCDDPRESNTEGGIFPAIFGTVLMVLLMTLFVAPLGVLAALYLREYARQGAVVRLVRIAVNNLAGVPSIVFGVFGLGFFVYLVGGSIDQWFFGAALPRPTFGTGGVLWAALTLALLTVPVVIVATEEGLAAVPRITREASLALGATKWETTRRVVIPAAAPAMLTGVILAIARAAGEVAPLMIVGMVKLADLPLDHRFPFLHVERKLMHLGFHIYDVGFQSPDVDATRPLVYATALLLVVLVFAMNLVAIAIRNHLRRRYESSVV